MSEYSIHIEDRPWGHYVVLDEGANHKVQKVMVNPESRISLQLHKKRDEYWIIAEGKPLITIGSEKKFFSVGETAFIPKQTVHRIENNSLESVSIIEVQIGKYLEEDDAIRLEDDYHRV